MQDIHENSDESTKAISRTNSCGRSLSLKSNTEHELSKPEYPWLAKTRYGHYRCDPFQSRPKLSGASTADVERGDSVSQDGGSSATEIRGRSFEDGETGPSPLVRTRSAESVEDPNLVSDHLHISQSHVLLSQ